jgi:hypothetical protein
VTISSNYRSQKLLPVLVFKIDLPKVYNRVSLLYLFLLLLHIGSDLSLVKWIMAHVTSISLVLLINGGGFSFFNPSQGLY